MNDFERAISILSEIRKTERIMSKAGFQGLLTMYWESKINRLKKEFESL